MALPQKAHSTCITRRYPKIYSGWIA